LGVVLRLSTFVTGEKEQICWDSSN